MKNFALLALTCLSASACVTSQENYQYYLQGKGITSTSIERFQHCYGYGCKKITQISLSEKAWHEIEQLFTPPPKNAEQERKVIATAIGLLETRAGAITGTSIDKYGTFRNFGELQLDCVDESTNTTIYLLLLKAKELLKFHKIESPTVRLPIIHAGRWPHQTATITEIKNSKSYAVDSWFHDNGFPAEIIALQEWKKGWKPENHKQHGDISNKE